MKKWIKLNFTIIYLVMLFIAVLDGMLLGYVLSEHTIFSAIITMPVFGVAVTLKGFEYYPFYADRYGSSCGESKIQTADKN